VQPTAPLLLLKLRSAGRDDAFLAMGGKMVDFAKMTE
jgi:hypothetical protein